MISGILIPSGPLGEPSFSYIHRERFNLQDLYDLIGCDVFDSVVLGLGQVMYVDDLGRQKGLALNGIATSLYNRLRGGDYIVGNAVVLGYDNEGETCSVSSDTVLLVCKMATAIAHHKGDLSELA